MDRAPLMRRIVRWTPALVTLAAVTAVHAWALLGGAYFLDVYVTEVQPHLEEVRRALHEGTAPFWAAGLLLGYPLAANPQVGAFYLPHLLLLAWLDTDQVLVISAWAHSLLGAFGALGLARRLGLSAPAATAVAVVYGTAPFVVFYHQAIHGLVALGFLPWIVRAGWEIGCGERRRLWWISGAFMTALALYGGHIQLVFYAGIASAVAAFVAAERHRLRVAALVAAMGLSAGLIYAPQLLPARELWAQSLRHDMSAADIVGALELESLGPDDAVEAVMPRFFGGPSRNDFWYPEFLGAPLLLLAAVGAPRGRTTDASRLGGALVALAVVVLVTVRVPWLGEAMLRLPGMSVFRAPGRVFVWILLGAPLLAGAGLELLARDTRPWLRRPIVWASLATLALGLAVGIGVFDSVAPRDLELAGLTPALRRADGLWLALAGGVLGLAATSLDRLRSFALAAALIWPVVQVGLRYNPTVDVVRVPPAAVFLSRQSPGRVLGVGAGDPDYLAAVPGPGGWPYSAAGDAARATHTLVADVGLTYGLSGLHAQTSLPLRRVVHRVFGGINALDYPFKTEPEYDARLLAHLGITHIVSRHGGQMPVSPRPPTVFERDGVLVSAIGERRSEARFYPSRGIRVVPDESAAMALVRRAGLSPDVPLIVEVTGDVALTGGGASTAPIDLPLTRPARGVLDVRVTALEPGVVAVIESAFPGWTAEVDGAKAPVLVADGAFLAVAVGAGQHQVVFRFAPNLYRIGLWGLALGLLLTAGLGRSRLVANNRSEEKSR